MSFTADACGGVGCEINGSSRCRNFIAQWPDSGSAFALTPVAAKSSMNPGELVGIYASSPGAKRMFCKNCRSPIAGSSESMKDSLFINLGSLDDDPGVRPSVHMFVGSKAPSYEITEQAAAVQRFLV